MGLPEIKKAENFAGVQGPQAPVGCRGNAPAGGPGGLRPPAAEDFLLFEHQLEASPGSFFSI